MLLLREQWEYVLYVHISADDRILCKTWLFEMHYYTHAHGDNAQATFSQQTALTSGFTCFKKSKLNSYSFCPFAPWPCPVIKKNKLLKHKARLKIQSCKVSEQIKLPLKYSVFSCTLISRFCKRDKSKV